MHKKQQHFGLYEQNQPSYPCVRRGATSAEGGEGASGRRRTASIVLGSLLEGQPFGLFSLRVVPKQLKLVSYGVTVVAG